MPHARATTTRDVVVTIVFRDVGIDVGGVTDGSDTASSLSKSSFRAEDK